MSTKAFFGGGKITLKTVHLGKGIETDKPGQLTAIKDYVMDADIVSYKKESKSIHLLFAFDNAHLETGFNWTEYGIIAAIDDGAGNITEGLFCYGYDNAESPNEVPKFTGANSYFKGRYNITVSVGDAENVTVDLKEFTDFTPQEDFDDHIGNFKNPHKVDKDQIGLSNVPNVSTNDQTPTFEIAKERENISSGEKLTLILGKAQKLFDDLINHLTADNPHGMSPSKIGAAASIHSHSAANITSGILGQNYGGTGYTSLAAMLSGVGLTNMQVHYFSNMDPGGGFELIFKNKLYIGVGQISLYAEGGESNTGSLDFGANYFAQAPRVFLTEVTATKTRHCSVANVNRRGFDIYYHNEAKGGATNSINYLIIGFVTKL